MILMMKNHQGRCNSYVADFREARCTACLWKPDEQSSMKTTFPCRNDLVDNSFANSEGINKILQPGGSTPGVFFDGYSTTHWLFRLAFASRELIEKVRVIILGRWLGKIDHAVKAGTIVFPGG